MKRKLKIFILIATLLLLLWFTIFELEFLIEIISSLIKK
jgi:hypothetical protein